MEEAKVVRLGPGVSGAESPAAEVARGWVNRKRRVQMAQGIKGSGLSPEERKERARVRARDAYRKKKGLPTAGRTRVGDPGRAAAPTGFAATLARVDELVKRIVADAQELGKLIGS